MITLPDGRTLWCAPVDDVQSAILDLLNSAQTQIRLAMYALALIPAVDVLLAKHLAGVDVRLVLDSSQAGHPIGGAMMLPVEQLAEVALGGSPEAAQIVRLRAAAVPLVIGQSEHGAILHEKMCVVDGARVGYGSYNWSLSAALQSNHWVEETTAGIIAQFLARWQADWTRLGGA